MSSRSSSGIIVPTFLITPLFLLLAFPLFFFVYKFLDPEPIAHDFFQYHRLYLNMDVRHTHAPFNMRVLGCFMVHLVYKCNVFYDCVTAFDSYQGWGFLKQVFFASVLFNFLCVSATATLIFYILKRMGHDSMLAFGGGAAYLLGGGTIFYHLPPLTDAFSTLLFTITVLLYLKKSPWILLLLAMFVFQREYLLLVTVLISINSFYFRREPYFLRVALTSAVFALVYYFLRMTVFATEALRFQMSLPGMMKAIAGSLPLIPGYMAQLMLGMNLVLIYALVLSYKGWKGLKIDKEQVSALVLMLVLMFFFCLGGYGANAGRYFYLAIPLPVIFLIRELAVFFPLRSDSPSH